MELIEIVFGVAELSFNAFLAFLELLGIVVDSVAWVKSRDNRRARREAKRSGDPLPPRERWTVVFVLVTSLLALLVVTTLWIN